VSSDRKLQDTRFAALKVKDAVVDRQNRKKGRRSSVDRRRPDISIVVHLNSGKAEISLDSTGRPLHMRGYRTEAGAAPLRETVAAGLILLAGWNGSTPLLDPFCGSGTIIIEAARLLAGILPGSDRTDFGFLRWPGADRDLFNRIRRDLTSSRADLPHGSPSIRGIDSDPDMVRVARANAERAGVSGLVEFEHGDFFESDGTAGVTIITNPPYGERLELEDAPAFFSSLGDRLKAAHTNCTAWILSANRDGMKSLGLRPSRRIPLYNGGLDSRLYRVDLY
jgi:putative N6-adenine-specific DNA methylase